MEIKPRILVTGANGFVGKGLCQELAARGYQVVAVTRAPSGLATSDGVIDEVVIPNYADAQAWKQVLPGIDTLVHLVARTHVVKEYARRPLTSYREINVKLTATIAEAALNHHVRRFILMSSVKVYGDSSGTSPWDETMIPKPSDPYGQSKLEAEQLLQRMSQGSNTEWVIIRPPLIYGPGVKANFLNLLRWVQLGIPLPLRAIRNKRSLVALENLVDFTIRCIEAPEAAREIFLVADDHAYSTPDIIRTIAEAGQKKARLFYIPVGLLNLFARLLGKQAAAQRLVGSLEVTTVKAKRKLHWSPPITMARQLQKIPHQSR